MKIANIVQDFNTGGIQKLLLEYLRYFQNDPEIQYMVVVLEENRHSIFDQIAEAEHLNIVYLNARRSRNSHYYIRKVSDFFSYNGKLAKWLLKNKPDIVHTHNSRIFKPIRFCIRLLNRRFPWFHTLHSDPYAVGEHHIPVIREMLNRRKIHAICLNNTQFMKAKERYGLERCDILYNVADFSKFMNVECDRREVRNSLHIPSDAYVVGTVGRLDPVKNYSFLLDVFSEAQKRNEKAMLMFVGDGDERDSLKRKAKDLQIEEKVRFLGIRSDVEQIYPIMDIFVSSSVTEASSSVVLEAQAAGIKCVVASSVAIESVCTETVVQMEKDASIEEWAQQILDPTNFAKPVSDFQDYSIEQNAKKMLEIYQKSMEKAGK